MRKITLFLSVLFMAMVVKAQTESEAAVKMTWVDYDNPTTAMGEIPAGETARAGYNKISGGSVAFANTGWGENKITYIQVDASSCTGNIIGATLSVEVSGSSDGKRTTCWGIGYNSSVWSADMTYESADKTITTFGDLQWTSTKSATTFENKEFNIYEVLKNDEDKILTLLVYETAAAGGYITNPKVTIKTGEDVPVTGISLDKNAAEITEGMVMNLLTATVAPENATDKTVTWSSSDENIATVDDGQITGVAAGTATITAEANGFTATCEVTVKAKVVKTSWDFAAFYETYGNKAGMTYAVNTAKVGGVDSNYGIGEYEGLAVQGAGKWFLYSSGGLYNGDSGHRNLGVLNLQQGKIITVVSNAELTLADATTANQLSVETVDGIYTYLYEMITDGTLALTVTRNKTLISIKVEDARELVVEDGKDLDASGTYTSASYVRKFNTEYTYGTICLPFAPDAATCANYTFYKLTEVNSTALYFEEEAEPKANTAYLYKLNDGVDAESAKTFTGGLTTISDIVAEGTGGWQFIGSFVRSEITDLTDGEYWAYQAEYNDKKDVLVKAGTKLIVNPYRAYFKFVQGEELNFTPAATTMRIVFGGQDGEAMGIQNVIAPEEIEGAVFDLEGRPVQEMQKGQIYIIGGKKVKK